MTDEGFVATRGNQLHRFDLGPTKSEHDRHFCSTIPATYLSCFSLSADKSQIIAGTSSGTIYTWRVAGKRTKPRRNAASCKSPVVSITTAKFVASGKELYATGSLDDTLSIWDGTSHTLLAQYTPSTGKSNAQKVFANLQFCPRDVSSSPWLAFSDHFSSQDNIFIVDVNSGQVLMKTQAQLSSGFSVARNGLAYFTDANSLCAWDTRSGEQTTVAPLHNSPCAGCHLSLCADDDAFVVVKESSRACVRSSVVAVWDTRKTAACLCSSEHQETCQAAVLSAGLLVQASFLYHKFDCGEKKSAACSLL
eukprot:TRINITY_DN898_c0_g1_i3.p1 TRINITY_DN898_c0_g1~~TRINITY_DN898_c0_g1_i3.p1  ORF type:complete len:307 (+),score=47.18 TRINITY_DN898_c0_g1_i3:425-1345(+)